MTKEDLVNLGQNELLALTIYGEARGEPIEGQIAVGCVIRNRAMKSGKTYQVIILEPLQFSCWNKSDPNLIPLLELADKLLNMQEPLELRQAQWIADGITSSAIKDNTSGASNYLEKTLFYSQKAPSWAGKMINTIIIGHHVFGSF